MDISVYNKCQLVRPTYPIWLTFISSLNMHMQHRTMNQQNFSTESNEFVNKRTFFAKV